MRNKAIAEVRSEVKVYEAYYKPSINLIPSLMSIFGVLLYGRTTVAPTPARRRRK